MMVIADDRTGSPSIGGLGPARLDPSTAHQAPNPAFTAPWIETCHADAFVERRDAGGERVNGFDVVLSSMRSVPPAVLRM
jgi:hypothetical protein